MFDHTIGYKVANVVCGLFVLGAGVMVKDKTRADVVMSAIMIFCGVVTILHNVGALA